MQSLRDMLFGSQLRRNIVSGSLITMIQVGIMAISFPVYLHFLGYETYGLWLVAATVLTLAQLGNLGLAQALMKLIAEHRDDGDEKTLQSYLSTASLILVGIGVSVALAVTALRSVLIGAFDLHGAAADTAGWLFPLVASLSAYVLFVDAQWGTLAGLGRMDLANYAKVGGRVLALITSVAQLRAGGGLESLLIGNFVGALFNDVVCRLATRRLVRLRSLSFAAFDRAKLRELVRLGLPSVASVGMSMLLVPFNNVMLSRYVGLHAIPIYEMGNRIAMEVRGLLANGLSALVPEVSSLHAQRDWSRIKALNARARVTIWRIGALVYVPVFAAAPLLLQLWLRSRYVDSLSTVLRVALVGSFVSLLGVPAYYSMLGVGRPEVCLRSHVAQSLINASVVIAVLAVTGTLTIPLMAGSVSVGYAASSALLLAASREFRA